MDKRRFFQTELTSSPGYFTNIHPKATWKNNFAAVITHGLKRIKIKKENIVAATWLKANTEEKMDSTPDDINTVPVPRFTLNTTVRK